MKPLSFSFFAALIFSLVGLAACGGGNSPNAGAQLTVENFAFTRLENGRRVFTGDVYNPGGESVPRAQISVSLLDANNRRIGTTTISVSEIAPRDTTSFREVFSSEQDVSGAEIESLTVM